MARGDTAAAREFWERSALLLPPDTVQYRAIRAHIENLKTAPQGPQTGTGWKKGAAGVGPALLLLFTKGKLLLLGLTKLSTLLSMLAFAGVYWALYGWTFAIGMVFSIYIHEMGHVLTLREYGIPASAPMFIPGFGAFIRLKQLRITPIQDSRVGLAGPIYGLGAAAFCLAAGYMTGAKAWDAIAHFGAVINIFNLTPVWTLDGSRGPHVADAAAAADHLSRRWHCLVGDRRSDAGTGHAGRDLPTLHEGRGTGAGQRRDGAVSGINRRVVGGSDSGAKARQLT